MLEVNFIKNRFLKRLIITIIDVILCIFSVFLSFYLRLGNFSHNLEEIFIVSIVAVILLIVFSFFRIYRVILRYINIEIAVDLLKGIICYTFLFIFFLNVIEIKNLPRSISLIHPAILFFLMLSYRIFLSFVINSRLENVHKKNALIYGFSDQGRELLDILSSRSSRYNVVGFVDDDYRLRKYNAKGIDIYNKKDLKKIIKLKDINEIILSLSEYTKEYRSKIIRELSNYNIKVTNAPEQYDLDKKNFHVSIKNLEIEDLLDREETKFNNLLPKNFLNKQIIIVTGAGGSIGSKICEELLNLNIKELILLDNSEYNLYSVQNKLDRLNLNKNIKIIPILGSILDKQKLNVIFQKLKPQIIFHSAAYKHVPIVEHNVVEGINNNVFGTMELVNLSKKYKLKKFILISTDKAVRPTNVMGATKRIAEIILQANASNSNATNFSMVRFGNVLGSSGSVVPLFWKQINDGGPVTITHPSISRYFMTDTEAAKLVIQASSMSTGGDVFVLDMGELIKIKDLALKMINFSGKTFKDDSNPFGDIEIKYIGLRPGEKLFEEIFIGNNPQKTKHSRIFRAQENFMSLSNLEKCLTELKKYIDNNDVRNIKKVIGKIVLDYKSNSSNVDWLRNDE